MVARETKMEKETERETDRQTGGWSWRLALAPKAP